MVSRQQPSATTGRTEPWALRNSLAILVVGAVGAALAFTGAYGATDGEDRDRIDAGITAATATAAIAAGVLTWGRLELARHEHRLSVDRDLTERYGRAVEQLGNGDTTIRVGGVFAMERVALDAFAVSGPDQDSGWRMARDMLAEFARQHRRKPSSDRFGSPSEGPDEVTSTSDSRVPPDIVAAVRALGRFSRRADLPKAVHVRYDLTGIDLHNVDLRGDLLVAADLAHANLRYANLRGADLTSANLAWADLDSAILLEANLTDADLKYVDNLRSAVFDSANLTRADLSRANLGHAVLIRTDLTEAILFEANLTDADLRSATLMGANLVGARLSRANLCGADLGAAKLVGADLTGADLTDVDLTRADLRYAVLTGVHLSSACLTDALHDENTRWPEHYLPPSSA